MHTCDKIPSHCYSSCLSVQQTYHWMVHMASVLYPYILQICVQVKLNSATQIKCSLFMLLQISVSEEMQYDDAFTLQQVREEHVTNFYYMAGMVPFIQKVIKDVSVILCINSNKAGLLNHTPLVNVCICNSLCKSER